LRPLDRAVICRLVYNHDLVPHVPFHIGGFYHLDKLVYITVNGDVIINPRMRESNKNFSEVTSLINSCWTAKDIVEEDKIASSKLETDKTPFEIECEKTPDPIKCHMPYWYLTRLEKLQAKVRGGKV
jgi:hypothetical protein